MLARLFRLWGISAYLDMMWMTRDLRMFALWALTDAVLSVASVTGMLLLAERFAGIGVWSKYQVIFMLGYAGTVNGLVEMGFGYNVAYISRRLGRGQLDHTLIQPQPIWMALLTEGFVPLSGASILLPGIGLLVWALRHLPIAVTPLWMALLLLSLLASGVVLIAFQFLWGSLAFWAPRAAEEVNSSTMRLMSEMKAFPLDGAGPVLAGGLMTVLPVGFVAWVPCRALLGLALWIDSLWTTPLAALVFGLLASLLFRKGLRHYGRTGAQGYSAFGHRG